jgi:hypothetical protein
VACLAGSFASAASIRFDDVSLGGNTGFLGYDDDLGILYGIDILFSDVQGIGGTLDDPTPQSCFFGIEQGCPLNFAVRATVDANFEFTIPPGPFPDFIDLSGEVAGITPLLTNVELLGSVPGGTTWTSSSGGQGQLFTFTGLGFDIKNDDLVEHYFGAAAVDTQFAFSLQLQTDQRRILGEPPGSELGIDYYWNILDAQLINTPRVPEPGTTGLFALGLALLALRRRSS